MPVETPKQLGFHMPAEWEEHSAVWLAWPHDKISFGSLNMADGATDKNRLGKIETKMVEIIKAIYESELVELLVVDNTMLQRTSTLLTEAGVDLKKITFHVTDYADIWLRDYGPLFISNSQTHEQAWIKWAYNAYGEKFEGLLKDNEVFFNLRGKIDKRMFEPGLIMESGAIDGNGEGTLITTEQCLFTRNPNISKTEFEKIFADNLRTSKVIWLKQGLFNDHTDGHIDELARFVAPNKIVCAYEDNKNDENYQTLKANYETLLNAADAKGNKFEVIRLPMPHMAYNDGNKAPVSYCNFYIGNEVVLAATFNDPNDTSALEIIQSCFPERKVVPIDCSDIIYGGGAIHCMTQQQPLI